MSYQHRNMETIYLVPSLKEIDTCRFLARCSALLGLVMDWLVQCQDNVTEWAIKSWC